MDAVLDLDGLTRLLEVLSEGHRLVGPTRRGEAIVLDDIDGVEDLPVGWGDHQEPGRYRLRRRDDDARFGYTTTTTSARPFLHPAHEHLVSIRRTDGSFTVEQPEAEVPLAIVGLRSCDLAGIGVQDRVFAGEHPTDDRYAGRRASALLVVVNCGEAGPLCFCASTGTGPRAGPGHDLALTELPGPDHRFVVEVGSERGRAVIDRIAARAPTGDDLAAAAAAWEAAAAAQVRHLDPAARSLAQVPDHPRWEDVADRCLSCTNCTLVCPTCFCGTVEDHTDLGVSVTERWRRWDSCFSLDHSHLPEGSVRSTTRARYRQWLTHKVSWWVDQFGVSGCVGCGRCIGWCPVGIDLTEEVAAMVGPEA